MKKFLQILENVGKDIAKGIEDALPIIEGFVPTIGPILVDIEQIIKQVEGELTTDQISKIVQSYTTVNSIDQWSRLKK